MGRIVEYVVPILGMTLMIVVLPFYLASGLTAPLWAIVVLLFIWVLLFRQAIKWFRTHPLRVALLPFIAAAIWFGVMVAGEAFLGWTA